MLTGKFFLECSSYFSIIHRIVLYIVVKFQPPNYNTFRNMNYFLGFLVQSGQTESDAYEPTVQNAQVGSKMQRDVGNEHTFKLASVRYT